MQTLPLEDIRHAVAAEEYQRAQLLWNESTAMGAELSRGHLSEGRLAEIRELVEWSRIVVLCERAQMQGQLNKLQAELRVAGGYELAPQRPTHRLVEASF